MRTEREVEEEIRRLKKCYTHGKDLKKDIAISASVQELKWVLSNTNMLEKRKKELYKNLESLKGGEKTAFNAIRRFELKHGTIVTLEDIKSDYFISDYLVGFGAKSRKLVLDNPRTYLY